MKVASETVQMPASALAVLLLLSLGIGIWLGCVMDRLPVGRLRHGPWSFGGEIRSVNGTLDTTRLLHGDDQGDRATQTKGGFKERREFSHCD